MQKEKHANGGREQESHKSNGEKRTDDEEEEGGGASSAVAASSISVFTSLLTLLALDMGRCGRRKDTLGGYISFAY